MASRRWSLLVYSHCRVHAVPIYRSDRCVNRTNERFWPHTKTVSCACASGSARDRWLREILRFTSECECMHICEMSTHIRRTFKFWSSFSGILWRARLLKFPRESRNTKLNFSRQTVGVEFDSRFVICPLCAPASTLKHGDSICLFLLRVKKTNIELSCMTFWGAVARPVHSDILWGRSMLICRDCL